MEYILDTVDAVEKYMARDLNTKDCDELIEMLKEDQLHGFHSVQHYAELMMTAADFRRVYGPGA